MTTYVATEPVKVDGFQDVTGKLHPYRDDAIVANFDADLRDAIGRICAPKADHSFETVLRKLAQESPDMLRILIGDRSHT